jgi:hypothetical protein
VLTASVKSILAKAVIFLISYKHQMVPNNSFKPTPLLCGLTQALAYTGPISKPASKRVMNSFPNSKNWIGSQVVTYETANWIGWVKEVKPNPDINNEIRVLVVPNQCLWFPKTMTGACEFSSSAVLIFGEDCLIVTDQIDIKTIPPNVCLKKSINSINRVLRIIGLLIAISSILLFLPIFLLFLVVFGSYKIYRKVLSRLFLKRIPGYPVQYWDNEEEDDDEGFSRMRQPQPHGPNPTDNIELEIPIIDRKKDMELLPVIRLQ